MSLPLNIELLEETFAALAPRGDELVADFYERLFERHPEVQPMFAGADMREQQTKLLGALATVVKSLRKPDELVPVLQELGVRHGALGAVAAHYDAVGPVLLESMAQIAGDAWTDEVEQAWAEAYGLIASVMIEAADDAEPAAEAAVETTAVEPTESESIPKTVDRPALKRQGTESVSTAPTSRPCK